MSEHLAYRSRISNLLSRYTMTLLHLEKHDKRLAIISNFASFLPSLETF